MPNTQQEALDLYEAARQRAFNDPAWFFNNVLRFPLLPWQLKAVDVVFDVRRKHLGLPTKVNHKAKPRLTIRSCHGPGKTQFLAALMHIWNFVLYGKIACTAPKEAQLTKRLLPRYRTCMKNAAQEYKDNIDVQGKEVIVLGDRDWGSIMETASDPDNLAGYHDTPQLFLVDEGSAKRLDEMYPVIEGALTTPGSVIVEIGNPTRIEGEFHSHHTQPKLKDLYYRMHIKYTDAPTLISQSWVDAMATKYGTESPVYLIRVAGEFAAYDSYILIQPDFIEDSLDIEEETDGSHPQLKISIDVADGGADSSVITAGNHYESFVQILKQIAYWFDASVAAIKCAKAAIRMMEGLGGTKATTVFIVDAIGVGAGCAGYLIEEGYQVVRNVGGEASDDPERFRNRRVQNAITLYDFYVAGNIRVTPGAIDDEEEFRAHLLSVKRNTDNEKVDDIEPKKKIKAEGRPSPDRFDSIAMQLNGVLPTMGITMIVPEIVGESATAHYDGSLI